MRSKNRSGEAMVSRMKWTKRIFRQVRLPISYKELDDSVSLSISSS